MSWTVTWTERRNPQHCLSKWGCGPRFHPRFKQAKVVGRTKATIKLEIIAKTKRVANDIACHIKSWPKIRPEIEKEVKE